MDTPELQADVTLDCSGMLCPMPVVKTAMAVKKMEMGQVLKMIATDPGAPPDIDTWAQQTNNTLLSSQQEGKQFIFYIKRTQ